MPDYGPVEYIVIYSSLGSEDLHESGVFISKEKADKFIESLENKAILVTGFVLNTEDHT